MNNPIAKIDSLSAGLKEIASLSALYADAAADLELFLCAAAFETIQTKVSEVIEAAEKC